MEGETKSEEVFKLILNEKRDQHSFKGTTFFLFWFFKPKCVVNICLCHGRKGQWLCNGPLPSCMTHVHLYLLFNRSDSFCIIFSLCTCFWLARTLEIHWMAVFCTFFVIKLEEDFSRACRRWINAVVKQSTCSYTQLEIRTSRHVYYARVSLEFAYLENKTCACMVMSKEMMSFSHSAMCMIRLRTCTVCVCVTHVQCTKYMIPIRSRWWSTPINFSKI